MNERIKKIHSKGYWRVNIRPTVFEEMRIPTVGNCREIVESCKIFLRGWDYPHIDREETALGVDWLESGCDFNDIIEYWRFYQSSQFIHHFSCSEDYVFDEKNLPKLSVRTPSPSGKYLSILSTLYRVTEIFEFAARLASRDLLSPSAQIKISLFDTENRQLFFWNSSRLLFDDYLCKIPEMTFKRVYSNSELMGSSHKLAMETTAWIFERFNWLAMPKKVLIEDQKKFLERRI